LIMKRPVKIIIENDSENFKTLYLEPWGEDYGMNPNDKFEIIEKEATDDFYFHIVCNQDILVWAEGQADAYPGIYKDGKELVCGHNRIKDKQ